MLGLTYTPVSPANDALQLRDQLTSLGVKLLFVSREKLRQTGRLFQDSSMWKQIQVIVFDSQIKDINTENRFLTFEELINDSKTHLERIPHFPVTLDSVMMIGRTSGTTGLPKGACTSHRALLSISVRLALHEPFWLNRHLPMLMSFALGHVSGNMVLIACWLNQTTTLLFNHNSVPRMFEIIGQYRIGQIIGGANLMAKMASVGESKHDLSSLKLFATSGSKIPDTTKRIIFDYGIHIVECKLSAKILYSCNFFLSVSLWIDRDVVCCRYFGKDFPHQCGQGYARLRVESD